MFKHYSADLLYERIQCKFADIKSGTFSYWSTASQTVPSTTRHTHTHTTEKVVRCPTQHNHTDLYYVPDTVHPIDFLSDYEDSQA